MFTGRALILMWSMVVLVLSLVLVAQDEPVPAPHAEPTEYCTPMNSPDGKKPCQCLHNSPNGCKNGQLDTEMANCNSYCHKKYCHCCSS